MFSNKVEPISQDVADLELSLLPISLPLDFD